MAKKYAMMVTVNEAGAIYRERAAKIRKDAGFAPIQMPAVTGAIGDKRIRNAVIVTLLKNEKIK